MEQFYKGYIQKDWKNILFNEGAILEFTPISRFIDSNTWYYNVFFGTDDRDVVAKQFNQYFNLFNSNPKDASRLLIDLFFSKRGEVISRGNLSFDRETEFIDNRQYYPKNTIEVIFEIITDKHGNKYAKELITNQIFPIITKRIQDKVYDKRELSYATDRNEYVYKFFNRKYTLNNTNISNKLEYFVIEDEYKRASTVEIEEYRKKYKNIFRKKKLNNKLEEYQKNNIYNEEIEIEEIKPEQFLSKSNELEKLENIEFLLNKLKDKDINAYTKLKEKLNILLNDISITTKLSELINLETDIEFAIIQNKYSDVNIDICEFLNNKITDYINYFTQNKNIENKLTLEELDKINELLIIKEKEYNLNIKMLINKQIALLYIFVIKDNNLEIKDIENSYFKNNLKAILIVLTTLEDNNIIDDILINYDNINIINIINLIKTIKFKKTNEKVLLKSIGG